MTDLAPNQFFSRIPAVAFAFTLLSVIVVGAFAWQRQSDLIEAIKERQTENAVTTALRLTETNEVFKQRMNEMQKELDFIACTQSPKSCSDGRLLNR
jgi:hypothetical protein